MTFFDTNRPTEEGKHKPKPDANMQPISEPKLSIRCLKAVVHSGYVNRRPASIFRRRPTYPREARNLPDTALAVKTEARADKSNNPDLRLGTHEKVGKNAPPFKLQGESRRISRGEQTHRAYWDVAADSSLLVNALLMAQLLFLAIQITNLNTTVTGLPSGIYGNIVEIHKASITTSITVDAQVPIDFMLPIQQNQDHDAPAPHPVSHG